MRATLATPFFLSSLLALFAPVATAATDSPDIVGQVDAYMTASVKNDHFIGNIVIARGGVPVVNRSYGMANIEWNVPNSPDTVFRIGSLTKQFTAMAVMQLQERGKLKVSDGICIYFDPCPAAWAPITIRHLLTHTSGIPNYTSLPDWDQRLSRLPQSRLQLVAAFRDLPLQFVPGEKFRYSNSGYYLLGLIIERAAGQPYATVLEKNIFAPLGMTHTGYEYQRPLIAKRAAGYGWSGNGFVNATDINVDMAYAAGALVSTTGDLLRWDQALNTTKLVSRKSLDEITIPFKDGYGYGQHMDTAFGHARVSHGGSIQGFSAYLSRYPDDRLTVIVLSNSEKTSATKVARDLSAIAFGEPVSLPTPRVIDVMWTTIQKTGVAAAVAQYQSLRKQSPDSKELGEDLLNSLGYDLMANKRPTDAVAIFQLAADSFPDSGNAHDSLAEALRNNGQRQQAITHYQKALALDPENDNAKRMLAELAVEVGAGGK